MSKELKSLIYRKNKAHSKFKSTFDQTDYTAFSLLHAKCKYTSKKCHKDNKKVQQSKKSLSSNPKKFWDFVHKHHSHNIIPNSVSLDGVYSSCKKESVNMFAKHLYSVYSSKSAPYNLQPFNIPFCDLPNNCPFTPNEVLLKLNILKNVSSTGPDGDTW